jgi:hypothetical protein
MVLIRISESRDFQEVKPVLKASHVVIRCWSGGKEGEDKKDSKAIKRSLDLVIKAYVVVARYQYPYRKLGLEGIYFLALAIIAQDFSRVS